MSLNRRIWIESFTILIFIFVTLLAVVFEIMRHNLQSNWSILMMFGVAWILAIPKMVVLRKLIADHKPRPNLMTPPS